MINTNYSLVNSNINNSSLQAYSASNNVQTNTTVQDSSTYNTNDTAVILTLSSEAKEMEAATYDAAKSSTLKVGSKGDAVKTLQSNLITLGYLTGKADGIFGANTKKAVAAFQRAYGLDDDGVVGSETQKAIKKALKYHNSGILAKGSRGTKVIELQNNLKMLGYYNGAIDGKFGSGTENAVVAFQKVFGLKADGIVGANTKSILEREVKNRKKGTLSLGNRGDDVKTLQSKLQKLGYLSDKPDGIFGSNTKKALTAFQKAYGLTANGIANSATQTAIAEAVKRKNKGILEVGSRGEDVKTLQLNLRKLGYLKGKADGIYGKDTKNAVIAFQKANKLKPDGIAGKSTRSVIGSVVSGYKSIKNGKVMTLPKPGETIEISMGTDKKSQKAKVSNYNAWSIEYSIKGCRKKYPNKNCTKRLNYVIDNYSYNKGKEELIEFSINDMKCFAGAMIEGFGNIGDIAEITLDDGTKFNFLILDTKSNKHDSKTLQENSDSSNPQCQNKYGHGYMLNSKKVQLSVCEFIVSESNGEGSAINYSNGKFLKERYVVKAQIKGHIPVDEKIEGID